MPITTHGVSNKLETKRGGSKNIHSVIETFDNKPDNCLASRLFGQMIDRREETEFFQQST